MLIRKMSFTTAFVASAVLSACASMPNNGSVSVMPPVLKESPSSIIFQGKKIDRNPDVKYAAYGIWVLWGTTPDGKYDVVLDIDTGLMYFGCVGYNGELGGNEFIEGLACP